MAASRNSGASPLPVASSSHRYPGRVFAGFLLLRFVFRLLLPASASPIDCFLVPPGSDVLLARRHVALPGFCGFREWPMRPDSCAPPVVSARSRLPGFSICCFVAPPPPIRRFAVTVSSDFVASFRDPGFSGFPRRICFPRLRRLFGCVLPVACFRLLPLRRVLVPFFSDVPRFRCSAASRRFFFCRRL